MSQLGKADGERHGELRIVRLTPGVDGVALVMLLSSSGKVPVAG